MSGGSSNNNNQSGDFFKTIVLGELEENGSRYRSQILGSDKAQGIQSSNSAENIRQKTDSVLHEILEPVLTINSERNNFPSRDSLSNIHSLGLSPFVQCKNAFSQPIRSIASTFTPDVSSAISQLNEQLDLFLADEIVFPKSEVAAAATPQNSDIMGAAKDKLPDSKLISGNLTSNSSSASFVLQMQEADVASTRQSISKWMVL
jgi:hypothetical protein